LGGVGGRGIEREREQREREEREKRRALSLSLSARAAHVSRTCGQGWRGKGEWAEREGNGLREKRSAHDLEGGKLDFFELV
jgi:hypothetical protein